MDQITFYFAEEGPCHGSEDIKKESSVNCFDFFFFLAGFHNKGVGRLLCSFLL